MPFDFPQAPLGFGSITVTGSNATAVGILQKSASWPRVALCLVGAAQSGRTTLLDAWVDLVGARNVSPEAFDKLKLSAVEALAKGHVAIDDAERVCDETLLLSLLHFAERSNVRILLTAQTPPAQWHARSADLQSRLNAMPVAQLAPPDEDMLRARIEQAGRRRFLKLEADVLNYLILRLGRNYSEIESFIERLSAAVTKYGRAPTVPLARDVLEETEMAGKASADTEDDTGD